jgi:hypothetical protein
VERPGPPNPGEGNDYPKTEVAGIANIINKGSLVKFYSVKIFTFIPLIRKILLLTGTLTKSRQA